MAIERFQDREEAIETGRSLSVVGGVFLPENLGQVVQLSQFMAESGIAVPKHLRESAGTCMAVINRALAWQMDPWAVATKTYSVNDVLAYESQLIAAVLKRHAPVREKVWNPIFEGEGPNRKCTITVHHRDTGEVITYTSPIIGAKVTGKEKPNGYVGIWPKNSPLWDADPDQQLYYYSIRALGRRHFSDIILGVYDVEEALAMRDITPKPGVVNLLDDPEDAPAAVHGEVIPPERKADEYREAVDRPYTEQEVNDAYVRAQKRGETVEPQVPLDEAEQAEADYRETMPMKVADRPEADSEQAELLPPDPQAELSTDRIYMNIVRGLKECRTSKDYGAWRSDNYTPEVRKKIGEERWKNLGEIMMEIETKVGWL